MWQEVFHAADMVPAMLTHHVADQSSVCHLFAGNEALRTSDLADDSSLADRDAVARSEPCIFSVIHAWSADIHTLHMPETSVGIQV